MELSWLKKLLLVVYVFGVIAVSIQLTAKSSGQIANQVAKNSLVKPKAAQPDQGSIQLVGYKN